MLDAIFFIIFFLLWWCCQGYFLFLYFGVRKKPFENTASAAVRQGSFFIIVPSCNERALIEKKIENLKAIVYPSFEVCFVDASDDGTAEIIAREIGGWPCASLVRCAERGRSFQLNEGLKRAKGDYVLITDVDARFDATATATIAASLAAPGVGVVGGYVRPLTEYRLDILFWRWHNTLKFFETIHGYSPIISGVCYAFKRELVAALPADTRADDIYVPLAAHLKGFACVYSSFVAVEELRGPQGAVSFARSKLRKSCDIIKEFLRFLPDVPAMEREWRIVYLTKIGQVVLSPFLTLLFLLLLTAVSRPALCVVAVALMVSLAVQAALFKKAALPACPWAALAVVFVMSELFVGAAALCHLASRLREFSRGKDPS